MKMEAMLLNVEAERIKHQMSRKELCDFLGVALRTYQNWLAGKSEMPLSKLMRLAETWGKSIDYLLGLTEQ